MKYIILISLIIAFLSVTSQDNKTCDKLEGSHIITASDNNVSSCVLNGFCFDSIAITPCKKQMSETPIPNKVNNIETIGDSLLIIDFQTTVDCSHDFLCEIEISNDSTLYLNYINYGGVSACMCCFGLRYYIKLDADKSEEIRKVKYAVINNYEYSRVELKSLLNDE